MTKVPTFAHVIKKAIDNRLLDIHTALIAKVESYDAEKQLVNVAPVLKRSVARRDGDFTHETLPLLCDVPVLFPRAGGYFISFPVKPGDFVQLIINETDIEAWFDESQPSIAHDERFTLQGAVALPGIFPQSMALKGAHETNLVLGQEKGLQIHIDGEKIRLGSKEGF